MHYKIESDVQIITPSRNPDAINAQVKVDDPDVTQLEIDINCTSISSSQNTKKRQLILINENLDLGNDIIAHSFREYIE